MALKTKLLRTIYRTGGFTPFHWINRQKLLILTYHRFSLQNEVDKLSLDKFADHLAYLKKYTNVISLSEAVEHLQNHRRLPPNSTVITVDDGYKDVFDIAYPMLNASGLPATLFAVTDFIDGKCWLWPDLVRFIFSHTKKASLVFDVSDVTSFDDSWRDASERALAGERINSILKKLPNVQKDAAIKRIAEILEVGIPSLPPDEYAPITWQQAVDMEDHNFQIESHTASHPILTYVETSDLDRELRSSKERLERKLKKTVRHLCYPNGDFSAEAKRYAENIGYMSAVTMTYGFNSENEDRYALKRISGPWAIENFAQTVSGFESAKLRISRS